MVAAYLCCEASRFCILSLPRQDGRRRRPARHGRVRALAEMGVAAHERFASGGPRAAQPRQRPALRAQGVPRAVQGRVDQAPSQLPRVVLLGAQGAPGRGRRVAAAGADGVGDLPDELKGALAAAVPVPPEDSYVIGGLTQPFVVRGVFLTELIVSFNCTSNLRFYRSA